MPINKRLSADEYTAIRHRMPKWEHFSHANNIERLAENNELMCDIEEAVKELMEALQEDDPMHMEGLRAAMAP